MCIVKFSHLSLFLQASVRYLSRLLAISLFLLFSNFTLVPAYSSTTTTQVPYLVVDPNLDPADGGLVIGDTIFLRSSDGELWKIENNSATKIDINPTGAAGGSLIFGELVSTGNSLYLVASDGTNTGIWRYDGTTASKIIDNYTPEGDLWNSPNQLKVIGNSIFFVAMDNTGDYELWQYDGAQTTMIETIVGWDHSSPDRLTVVDDSLYFIEADTKGIFKYDGISLNEIFVASEFAEPLFTRVGSSIYFSAFGDTGIELWKYDGTDVSKIEINPGNGSSTPDYLTVMGNSLYFQAFDGTDKELWEYDGTALHKIDINLGNGSSEPNFLTVVGNSLYFQAFDGTDVELWQYDSVTASKIDINLGAGSSIPEELIVGGDALYFRAFDGTDFEVWQYDGVTATEFDIDPDPVLGDVGHLMAGNRRLYFLVYDGSGHDLWALDYASNNSPPIAGDLTIVTPEDTRQVIELIGSDPDNDPLTFTVTTSPMHGVLTGSGANQIYTPFLNFNGVDAFTYKVNDGSSDSNIATVNIAVVSAASQIGQLGMNVQALISGRALSKGTSEIRA